MAYTTINKSKEHFSTKLYTGTGSAPNAQTGVGHRPDLVWIKPRNLANSNRLHSSLLTAPDYFLISENTDVEATNNNCITSFDSDGFTLGNTDNGWNGSYNYVSWNWKGGTTSGITQGSANITPSSYTFNSNAGLSFVKYTGNGSTGGSIPHGLGVKPAMVWIKSLTDVNGWKVWHKDLQDGYPLALNTNQASDADSNSINTCDTGKVITQGTHSVNESSDNYFMCVFAEKAGFSKIDTYRGNGSNDGPFVYCGFKPSMVILKEIESTSAWFIIDNERTGNSGNPNNLFLRPNTYDAETNSSWHKIDFLSNGFKIKDDDADINDSSYNYIFAAFAEAPLVGSNNIPCTAR